MKRWRKTAFLTSFTLSCTILLAEEKTEPIRFSPKEIRIELSQQEAQTAGGCHWGKIMILDGPSGRLEITDVQSSPNVLTMVYDLTYRWPSGAKAHAFRVETRLKPVDQVGTLSEWVRLSTNHPECATIEIPITYHVQSSVHAIPKTLLVNRFLDSDVAKRIRLTTSMAAGLEIEPPTAADPWLAVHSARVDPNTVDLEASILELGSAAKKVLQSTITARIVRPEHRELTIPVVLLPRLGCDDPGILSVITLANRLNAGLLDSFRCRYTSRFQRGEGWEINQIHEYAVHGRREHHRIENIGSERPGRYCYIRNDGQAYGVSEGLVDLAAKRPAGLFDAAAATGAGVLFSLDALDPRYEKVVSVEETVADGQRCLVVSVEQYAAASAESGPHNILTLYFSIEDGLLPVRVDSKMVEKAGGTSTWGRNAVVTKILRHQVQGSTFRVPIAFRHETYRDGRLHETAEFTVDEQSVEIDRELPEELFRVQVQPDGLVIDRGLVAQPSQAPMQLSIPGSRDFFAARTSLTSAQGGFMDAKVIFGQEFARFWDGSLEGRTLPGWEGIHLDLHGESLEGRALLVCFWDVNQRPSRRCLDQLVGHAESLKDGGVAAVAIQTAKVDEGALQTWIKENTIPCAIGRIVGDVEQVRTHWAVRSLPRLILTDRRHRVLAEGFDIDRLPEMLSLLTAP